MASASHAVHVNGICASRMLGRSRAFAAAADAVAARPDAVVSVVRYHAGRINPETVAVVHRPETAPAVDAAPAVVRYNATGDVPAVDLVPAVVSADAAYHAAWCAADTATADLVRFDDVRDVVAAASVAVDDVRRRVAATTAARPYARDAAMQRRDAVTDDAYARVVDAVADAADGYEPDAVAVVVVPSASFGAYATLQRAGVACIRPAAPADCAPAGAWCGTDGVRPSLSFLNVADALTYATGHAAPSRMPRRARRSPVLPGETAAPAAQSHGAAAPTLPRLSGAAR
jgi:hypothetical protein